jgi:hypothetical protein
MARRFVVVEYSDRQSWRGAADMGSQATKLADAEDVETLLSQLIAKTGADLDRVIADGGGGAGGDDR